MSASEPEKDGNAAGNTTLVSSSWPSRSGFTAGHSADRNVGANDVYLFRTPHLPTLSRAWREKAGDVAMATSAAATYLPGMSLSGARLADGGVWANNPAMVALTEAVGPLGKPLDEVRIFSLEPRPTTPAAAAASTAAACCPGPATQSRS